MSTSSAEKIIDDGFGGTRAASEALSVAPAVGKKKKRYPPSTIQSWKTAGYIPPKHHQWVLQVAQKNGLSVKPSDFFAATSPNR